jgi:hypothetical protein
MEVAVAAGHPWSEADGWGNAFSVCGPLAVLSVLLAEIPPGLQLKVNQPYPTSIPLVTAPPRLLARLPMIPEELEYRPIDRRLLLRDRDANLIVDVLIDPTLKRAE